MNGPLELHLDHPIEVDNIRYDKLTLSDLNALANFRINSPEQIIRSMALCFNVPRRVIRHLRSDDVNRAGDLIVSALNTIERTFSPLEHFE
jgi:hypothetical protein